MIGFPVAAPFAVAQTHLVKRTHSGARNSGMSLMLLRHPKPDSRFSET